MKQRKDDAAGPDGHGHPRRASSLTMLPGSPNISAMKSRKALVIAILLIMAAAYAQQPEEKRPERIRVSSGVAEGLLVHKVDPVYPREAIEKKIQGDVVLQVVIDTQGSVATLTTLSGTPLLPMPTPRRIDSGTTGLIC